MKFMKVILGVSVLISYLLILPVHISAQDQKPTGKKKSTLDIVGLMTDPKDKDKPLSKAKVRVNVFGQEYESLTDEKGRFVINAVDPSKKECDCRVPFLLMIPALFGLAFAAVKAEVGKRKASENQFFFALANAITWIFILYFLASYMGIQKLHFFDPALEFGFFVPILGFLGAMLFVLDMFRKGREDILLGKEFGIRIIMGPYVAIVMVLLAKGLGLAELQSPVKTGAVAFFSGLLVVYAFQMLVEMGQEFLGNLRRKIRYEPSEIAKKFNLEKEDDAKLRVAGITHLFQLEIYTEDELKAKAITVKVDEYLLIGIKKEYEKIILEKAIGTVAWEELKKKNVNDLKTFAMLTEKDIDEIAAGAKMIDGEQLKGILRKAKKLF